MTAPRYRPPKRGHVLVAVDLGKRKVGLAVGACYPGGPPVLLAADTVTLRGEWSPHRMARSVHQTLQHILAAHDLAERPQVWVCEWPKKYRRKTKYHQAIETLWAVGDALDVKWNRKYSPHRWKGQVHKDAHHERVLRALTESELTSVIATLLALETGDGTWLLSEQAHDARDAMGIWLYATGRTKRGGI